MSVLNVNEKTIKDRYENTLKELAKYDEYVTEKQWFKIAKEKDLLIPVVMKGYSKISWGEIYREAKRKYKN